MTDTDLRSCPLCSRRAGHLIHGGRFRKTKPDTIGQFTTFAYAVCEYCHGRTRDFTQECRPVNVSYAHVIDAAARAWNNHEVTEYK